MGSRLKAVLPLTVSIGVLAFLASELALNFTFHWVTVKNGVFGAYGVPQGLQLALPQEDKVTPVGNSFSGRRRRRIAARFPMDLFAMSFQFPLPHHCDLELPFR